MCTLARCMSMMGKEFSTEVENGKQGRGSWEPIAVPCGLGTMSLRGEEWQVASFAFRADDPDAFLRLIGAAYSIPFGKGQFEVLKCLAVESRMGSLPIMLTQDQIAEKADVSKSTVLNAMRALRAPLKGFEGRAVLTMVEDGIWSFDPWALWRVAGEPLHSVGQWAGCGEDIPA